MSAAEDPILAAWEALAPAYDAKAGDKPHNAHYDRPAVLSLLGDVAGRRVIDAGCGPGFYAEAMLEAGAAEVLSADFSPAMIAAADRRLARFGPRSRRLRADLATSWPVADGWADLVAAPLWLDYVADWAPVFAEAFRALRPGGAMAASFGHPQNDAAYFDTDWYFEVEPVTATWRGFGDPVEVPSYRRPLAACLTPALEAGFALERIVEPRPTEAFRARDPRHFAELERRPAFLALRLRRP